MPGAPHFPFFILLNESLRRVTQNTFGELRAEKTIIN
jgi:hypothetical protein